MVNIMPIRHLQARTRVPRRLNSDSWPRQVILAMICVRLISRNIDTSAKARVLIQYWKIYPKLMLSLISCSQVPSKKGTLTN